MLTCDQAEKMVMPYINNELSDSELEPFLKHIRDCPKCREDLEITFTIDLGLLQLTDKTDEDDFTVAFENSLSLSWLRVRARRLRDVICCVVDTLCATCVIAILIMQIAIWMH